ncbi:MAG: glycoside hydrolase family 31 protein [Lachnospiraceae bacterium]|nr:glycoside hydrolase family 31 protein [Lachnospiraceae bacterium]
MLSCVPCRDMCLKKVTRENDALTLTLERGTQRIVPVDARTVRILYSRSEPMQMTAPKPCLADLPSFSDWSFSEDERFVYVKLPELQIRIDKTTNRFFYTDRDGRLLLKERKERSKELTEIPVYRLAKEASETAYVDTADGRKPVIRDAARVQTGTAYHTRLHLEFDPEEALYGLGQHEEGFHSLRGSCVYLNQANRTIAIPFFVSTKGYGVFVNTCSPSVFYDNEEGSCFYTEADPEMDFFFMNGGNMDGVIRCFRKITGKAAMLPKWAFGYIQSQERYESQEEILAVAGEYRKRGIGLDCIVLDWMSWPDGQWGQKSFDPLRFPDPDAMISALHENHIRFMISIWPNMSDHSPDIRAFQEQDLLLPGTDIYNALDANARKLYWSQVKEGLFSHGVDAWWCDNSEPVCPEWTENERPENAGNFERYCRQVADHIPAPYTNAFGLYHAMAVYEGQRSCDDKRRVVNLTRSGYPGQQRFGTILWSGDISASWDTLRRQIAAGLQFCASGMPYWTVDIGAFFVKNGTPWYWNGEYDRGAEDPAYCELFTRWYQWAAFLPVFRGHGTDVRRELWHFDRKEAPFYQALQEANRLRYQLLPYIYTTAAGVYLEDGLIMRPLSYGFTEDKNTWDIFDQYLFGDALMVCPVTRPMLFGEGADGKMERSVYLPAGTCWYDFYSGKQYEGGQWITAEAPLERIPVFARAGAIIPMTKAALSVAELSDELTLRVYAGADSRFSLYEDDGDGYGYEKGVYRHRVLTFDDQTNEVCEDGQPVTCAKVTIIHAT